MKQMNFYCFIKQFLFLSCVFAVSEGKNFGQPVKSSTKKTISASNDESQIKKLSGNTVVSISLTKRQLLEEYEQAQEEAPSQSLDLTEATNSKETSKEAVLKTTKSDESIEELISDPANTDASLSENQEGSKGSEPADSEAISEMSVKESQADEHQPKDSESTQINSDDDPVASAPSTELESPKNVDKLFGDEETKDPSTDEDSQPSDPEARNEKSNSDEQASDPSSKSQSSDSSAHENESNGDEQASDPSDESQLSDSTQESVQSRKHTQGPRLGGTKRLTRPNVPKPSSLGQKVTEQKLNVEDKTNKLIKDIGTKDPPEKELKRTVVKPANTRVHRSKMEGAEKEGDEMDGVKLKEGEGKEAGGESAELELKRPRQAGTGRVASPRQRSRMRPRKQSDAESYQSRHDSQQDPNTTEDAPARPPTEKELEAAKMEALWHADLAAVSEANKFVPQSHASFITSPPPDGRKHFRLRRFLQIV